jgi:type IV pilus assembly protein PilC
MFRLNHQQLSGLFHRVGIALQAGVDILRVWEMERERAAGFLRDRLGRLHERLRQGESLADSMEACEGYFPRMALEMVRVGEETGRLEAVLLRLADHYRHMAKLRRDFLTSIQWPALQFFAAVGILSLLILVMGFLPGDTDLLGWGLTGVSGMLAFLVMVAFFLLGLFLIGYSLARGWWGATPIVIAMRVPILGTYLESMALSRYTWSLGVAIDAGMEPRYCMRLALRSTQNPVYLFQSARADRVLMAHGEFWESMQETGVFPRDLVEMMQTAELAGTQTETLLHQARNYDDRFQSAARNLSFAIGVIIRVAVAMLLIALIFRLAGVYLGALTDATRI